MPTMIELHNRLGLEWDHHEQEGVVWDHFCPEHTVASRPRMKWEPCFCPQLRDDWKPVQFLAAYRKCSLEQAQSELCELFPPPK